MVLTEAFAAGTPVVASDIAGYRDVVRDGVDGVLVPRGDAQALAEALRDLWEEPERRAAMARNAARDVERFAWPHVAAEVMEAYRDAIAVPSPQARDAAPRGPDRAALGRPQAARARAPPAQPGADPGRSPSPSAVALAAPLRARRGVAGRDRARRPGAQQDRPGQHHQRADQLQPQLRPARAGDHVRRDGDARLLVARDPPGRAARRAGQARRRHAGNLHRSAHVLDAAGAAR